MKTARNMAAVLSRPPWLAHSSFTVILGVYRAFNGQYVYLNAHIIISWKTKMFPWSGRLVFSARGRGA